MSASRYIGRIGGLAAALGVGAAVFISCDGTAWANSDSTHTSDSTSHPAPKPVSAAHPKPNHDAPATRDSTTAPPKASTDSATPKAPPTNATIKPVAATAPSTTTASTPAPSSALPHAATAVVAGAVTATASAPATASTPATATSVTAASSNTVVATTIGAGASGSNSGNSPATPADAVVAAAVLVANRQQKSALVPTPAAATVTTPAVTANPTPAITVNPTLFVTNGFIEGSADAVDSNGLPLTYTVISGPSQGGKLSFDPELAAGGFTYLPYATVLTSGTETFREMVSETTPFDSAVQSIPLLGGVVPGLLVQLHQIPGLGDFLAPLIGASTVAAFIADPSALNTTGNPIAYTVNVKSFDGTLISTNFFPAAGLATGSTAPTVLEGPGLGSNGITDPLSTTGIDDIPGLVPGVSTLRDAGYDVVSWDPRGEGASGGTLQLDNPNFEGKDVSAILDYVQTLSENTNRFGMVGGSYGGGIQLTTAAIDHRINAIVPGIAWNTLNEALYPSAAFKTSWATILVLDLLEAGARINPEIYGGILTGFLTGYLTQAQQDLLTASGPGPAVSNITAPTLLLQGTADGLFPLQQAVVNEEALSAAGTPVKMVWFCGGHGVCLDPINQAAQTALLTQDTLAWLNQYVAQTGTAATSIPTFQWIDQAGNIYSSNQFPNSAAFEGTPLTASITNGGIMPIIPIIGGAGPSPKVSGSLTADLVATATASPASNAINLNVSVPGGTQIVGAPTVTIAYSGLGNGRDIYAQIVDDQTGLVLGNLDTPVPVVLNGQTHTATVSLNDIAYTAAAAGGLLTLQLVASATQYENFTSIGGIQVSNLSISLPTVGSGVATEENPAPPV
ncbi:MAG: CocE/NonD family hydrolase [Mycobacterium sp.]|nr:CocE/NonD family hydrolase [Mycobacterium sp.]